MKTLDLSHCVSNAEVCELISARVNKLTLEELIEKVSEEFVYQESTIKAIYVGLSMSMNVFLSGPPGYGKTDTIKKVLDVYKIPYHTLVGYKDMPVDALLGIPDMSKLLKSSEYEINFKKSLFYRPGILILEEFGDVLPMTAASLKDILSEKGYRDKKGKIESLIGSVIVSSNKSAAEISSNVSLSALYESRFPIKTTVSWKTYEASRYFELLKKRFNSTEHKTLYFMAKLFELNYTEQGTAISPRLALDSTRVYLSKGIEYLKFLDIDLQHVERVMEEAEEELYSKNIDVFISKIEAEIEKAALTPQALSLLLFTSRAIKSLSLNEGAALKVNKFSKKLDYLIEGALPANKACIRIKNIIHLLTDGE